MFIETGLLMIGAMNQSTDCNLKVCRPKDKRLDRKYTRGTVKYGGGKGEIIWDCFLAIIGVGPIHRIYRIIIYSTCHLFDGLVQLH